MEVWDHHSYSKIFAAKILRGLVLWGGINKCILLNSCLEVIKHYIKLVEEHADHEQYDKQRKRAS